MTQIPVASVGGRIKALVTRTLNVVGGQNTSHKYYESRRPCRECGGSMVYRSMRWSIVTGKYLRSCESCGYTDPRPVKMVRQI